MPRCHYLALTAALALFNVWVIMFAISATNAPANRLQLSCGCRLYANSQCIGCDPSPLPAAASSSSPVVPFAEMRPASLPSDDQQASVTYPLQAGRGSQTESRPQGKECSPLCMADQPITAQWVEEDDMDAAEWAIDGEAPSNPNAFDPWLFDHEDQCWLQLGPAIDHHCLVPGTVCSRSWRYRVAHKLPKEHIGRLQEMDRPGAGNWSARSWLARQTWWHSRPLLCALAINASYALLCIALLLRVPKSRRLA